MCFFSDVCVSMDPVFNLNFLVSKIKQNMFQEKKNQVNKRIYTRDNKITTTYKELYKFMSICLKTIIDRPLVLIKESIQPYILNKQGTIKLMVYTNRKH